MRRGALFVVVVFAVLLAWHPARVAVQALVLLPAIFPQAPVDPLALVTATPRETELAYPYEGGTVNARLFVPDSVGPHPAMLLLLGAGELPRSDLADHFASALARLGIVSLIPESSGMLAEHLSVAEVDAIRASVDQLDARADVDPARIGVIGLSASGGVGIVAAAEPDLRDRIRFVNSFGSFADTRTLLIDVLSRSIAVDGQTRPWTPDPRTVEVVGNALADAGVEPAQRAQLVGGGLTRAQATALLTALPAEQAARLARLSPTAALDKVRAHLYLMHDVDDAFIPFTESRALAARAPRDVMQRYTEFDIFAHVIPDRPVPWQTFVPDVWRLFWHVHAVLMEVL